MQCPNCHLEQIPEKHWAYQKNGVTNLIFDKPKKLNLLVIFISSFVACLLLLQFLSAVYTQAHNGNTPPDPKLGLKIIEGSVALSAILGIILLLYRELGYRWNLRWFEKMKKTSTERYSCAKCGARWDA